MKIQVKEFNLETQEEITFERDLTTEELKVMQEAEIALQLKTESEAIKTAEKAALLAKLGITEDEAKLLLS